MEKILLEAVVERADQFTKTYAYNNTPLGEEKYNPYVELREAIKAHPENTVVLVNVFKELDNKLKLTNDALGFKEGLAIKTLAIGVKQGWVSDVVKEHAKSADVSIEVVRSGSSAVIDSNGKILASGQGQSQSKLQFTAAQEISAYVFNEAEKYLRSHHEIPQPLHTIPTL